MLSVAELGGQWQNTTPLIFISRTFLTTSRAVRRMTHHLTLRSGILHASRSSLLQLSFRQLSLQSIDIHSAGSKACRVREPAAEVRNERERISGEQGVSQKRERERGSAFFLSPSSVPATETDYRLG